MSQKKIREKTSSDIKAAAQALEVLLAAGYVNKKRLFLENFLRGIFFSAGTVVGAALVVTLLLWILSLFDSVPFVNDITRAIDRSIQK